MQTRNQAYDAQNLACHTQGAAEAVDAGFGGFLEGMLPDADDFPALASELAVHAAIASHVVCAFFVPEFPVGFWAGAAPGAATPETSVEEDRDLLLSERKVGLSE